MALVVMLALLFLVVVVAFSRFGTREHLTAAETAELVSLKKDIAYFTSVGLTPANNEAAKKADDRFRQLNAKPLGPTIIRPTVAPPPKLPGPTIIPPTVAPPPKDPTDVLAAMVAEQNRLASSRSDSYIQEIINKANAQAEKDRIAVQRINDELARNSAMIPMPGIGQTIVGGKVVDAPGFSGGKILPAPSSMPAFTGTVAPMPGFSIGPTATPPANSTGAQLALLKTMELVEYLKALINNKK